jgi:cytochrome c5
MLRLLQLGAAALATIAVVHGSARDSRAEPSARAAVGHRVAQRPIPAASDSQAELGRRWFAASCEECHVVDDVTSPDFKAKWGGRSAYDLFDQISRTMPEETPGSLPRRAYVDIIAYFMQQNGIVAAVPLADDDSTLAATVLQFAPSPTARR